MLIQGVFMRNSNMQGKVVLVTGVTGGYFHRSKMIEPSKAALDDAAARCLWEVSLELVGEKN